MPGEWWYCCAGRQLLVSALYRVLCTVTTGDSLWSELPDESGNYALLNWNTAACLN